jgi:hypothetical protein
MHQRNLFPNDLPSQRNQLIKRYLINDAGLTELIDDVKKKPVSVANINLLTQALQGYFSQLQSPLFGSDTPRIALQNALNQLGYADLMVKLQHGSYKHEKGATLCRDEEAVQAHRAAKK